MRTTVDLPDNLHEEVRRLAFDRRLSQSKVIADLVDQALRRNASTAELQPRSSETGLITVRVGRPITDAEVAAMDDEW